MNGSPFSTSTSSVRLLLLALDVDVGVPVVAKDPKQAVDAYIEARRLHQRRVVRIDHDPSLVDQTEDRPVGENHAAILTRAAIAPSRIPDAVRSVIRCPCFTDHGPERAFPRSTGPDAPDKTAPSGRGPGIRPPGRDRRRYGPRFVGDNQATRRARRPPPPRRPPEIDDAASKAASRRDPWCSRDGRARVVAREVPGIRRLQALRAQHDRARREGRRRRDRLPDAERAARGNRRQPGPSTTRRRWLRGPQRHLHDRAVVCFQDPTLARERPISPSSVPIGALDDGRRVRLGEPYDRRVWDYCASVAQAAAKAGFDQIMFDYVRFPSDGDLGNAVYPGKTSVSKGRVIADFVEYAKKRLEPTGPGSPRPSSGSRRRATSASGRFLAGSRSTSTTCRRCRTRCSTETESSGCRARAPSRARPCSGR